MNLRTIISTPAEFRVEDALRFEMVALLPGGERGSMSGKELFRAMMAHFTGRIRIIEGNWSEYGFDQVWIALKSGRPGSYDYVQAQFS